ncbi:unnamed protein product [Pleuronectes platessa]|uniref:Uncharacterized protein n=1 Tax=Pleuronectes platessa TaxID=8262 RepID=A0A9N7UUF7_PLEPL|nr:unnamed protein product [Pleuronectes platessa]
MFKYAIRNTLVEAWLKERPWVSNFVPYLVEVRDRLEKYHNPPAPSSNPFEGTRLARGGPQLTSLFLRRQRSSHWRWLLSLLRAGGSNLMSPMFRRQRSSLHLLRSLLRAVILLSAASSKQFPGCDPAERMPIAGT